MTVLLSSRSQSAVRRLLMAEPEPGAMLPRQALHAVGQLVGCDAFGIGITDKAGFLLRETTFPQLDLEDAQVCDGPVPTGFQHDATKPPDERDAAYYGLRDLVRLGFNTGSETVTQLFVARRRSYFSEQDIAVLTMVEPAIGRLVRMCEQHEPIGWLTPSERRVLALVATGASNREVAEELSVTEHTVRKHLEHAYGKLGVKNRTAATLKLRSMS